MPMSVNSGGTPEPHGRVDRGRFLRAREDAAQRVERRIVVATWGLWGVEAPVDEAGEGLGGKLEVRGCHFYDGLEGDVLGCQFDDKGPRGRGGGDRDGRRLPG